VDAVADLRHDALKTDLAGVREHLASLDLEAFTELDVRAGEDLLELGLALDKRQLPEIATVEIEQIEDDRTIFTDSPLSSFCRTSKSVVPPVAGTAISPSITADAALMCQASCATFLKRRVQS
jgi:hypothetical protein